MQIEKYLKTYQPVVYQTFVNSLKNKTLSHAYLLVGNPGTPLYDVAQYLAKSILCDDPSPLACDNCITCMRFDSDNYPDVIKLDSSKASIKKEDILNIESRFEKTALESKNIMIYIINLVENMNVESVNSMLKFLEEPELEIYAFLTTNNENNVLPTILSRCQILHLKTIDRFQVIKEAVELGVEQEDAELLSYFYNDAELIFNVLNPKKDEEEEKENYLQSKKAFVELINALNTDNSNESIYYMEKEIISLIKGKESMRFFLDMLIQCFEDLLNLQCSRNITLQSYATILHELVVKLPHISESLLEIMKQRNLVNLNLNNALQLDHLIIYITSKEIQ